MIDDDRMKIILHGFFKEKIGLCLVSARVAFAAERNHKTLKRFDDWRQLSYSGLLQGAHKAQSHRRRLSMFLG